MVSEIKRQTVWLAKNTLLFKLDLVTVHCLSCLCHQAVRPGLVLDFRLGRWPVFCSHRDTIGKCLGRRRVCRRRLCVA